MPCSSGPPTWKDRPSDLAKKLDAVNLGPITMQTMIFEPADLLLHLSLGPARRRNDRLRKYNCGIAGEVINDKGEPEASASGWR